jgi:pilus assembly protein CpaF
MYMSSDLALRIAQLEQQMALLIRQPAAPKIPVQDKEAVMQGALTDALAALAPLKALLDDDSINDILINGPNNVFVERLGKLERVSLSFANDAHIFSIAESIAAHVGREVSMRRPLLDARLPDGSRVNVIVRPLSVDGTAISIRKFAKRAITLDDMAVNGNTSASLSALLKVIARSRLNVIISGGTGSGKTTLLNAIAEHIDPSERIVTIEDAAELKLRQCGAA